MNKSATHKYPALLITREELLKDPELLRETGARGARKLLVKNVYGETEREAGGRTDIIWRAPKDGAKSLVQKMADIQMAVFTEECFQERHRHEVSTETYIVQVGEMKIEVEGRYYILNAGDIIIINPGITHEVKPEGSKFTTVVFTSNGQGDDDKLVVD